MVITQNQTPDGWDSVRCVYIRTDVTIDGFSITNRNADHGGGICNDYSSATITNCTLCHNVATHGGGGITNCYSSPTVTFSPSYPSPGSTLWSSNGGWVLTTPPYYAGSNYAGDLEVAGDGYLILHRESAIHESAPGWILGTPPYYPGTGYAVDREVR